MHELINLEQVHRMVLGAAMAAVPLGLLGGAAAALVTKQRRYLGQGAFLGLVGGAVGLLWLLYRWTVRIDPVAEYVGLYRPLVIAGDVVLFLALGAFLGWLWRRLFPAASPK